MLKNSEASVKSSEGEGFAQAQQDLACRSEDLGIYVYARTCNITYNGIRVYNGDVGIAKLANVFEGNALHTCVYVTVA